MKKSLLGIRRVRKSYAQVLDSFDVPNLIEIQVSSYTCNFLQLDKNNNELKENKGLQRILSSIFPIQDGAHTASLDFVSYKLDPPRYDVFECRQKGLTFVASMRVTLRLSIYSIDSVTGIKEVKSIKEQEVRMGDIPLMTKDGTFLINGTEKVIVSQLCRSPGVFFFHDAGRTHSSGKFLYFARIIPYRGSWLDLEFDPRDILHFRIDKKRKLPVTTLLMAMGMTHSDILDYFYQKINYTLNPDCCVVDFVPGEFPVGPLSYDLINLDNGQLLMKAGQRLTSRLIQKFSSEGLKQIRVPFDFLVNKYLASDVVDSETGAVVSRMGAAITAEDVAKFSRVGVKSVPVLKVNNASEAYIRNTLFFDKNTTQEGALADIFRTIRPGEPVTFETSLAMFNSLFFTDDRYSLSQVGRIKVNARLGLNIDENIEYLVHEDIKQAVMFLVELKDGNKSVDDIDHLGNRRVRSVGELSETQILLGVPRFQKSIRERMSRVDLDSVMPSDLIASGAFTSTMREFLNTSQLVQFMDQTNPLSEITHKRRLSALGPGGVSRNRAGTEVRDVHSTHYGRICPIETPEGQNIGLIASMASRASINKHGFIETPYRRVVEGKITNEIVYLSAIEEEKYKIAQGSLNLLDSHGQFIEDFASCRLDSGDFVKFPVKDVDFIDVASEQMVSVSASLIPFLENDDANRALMGSNMQRQAVPLVKPEAPFIGTGCEAIVANGSGACVVALHDGIVEQLDATRIVVSRSKNRGAPVDIYRGAPVVDIYNLRKFQKSNHSTCINQKPLVNVGDSVSAGEVIADGPAIDKGEIALGRNIRIAFLAFGGYNFEDAIVVSERIVTDSVFTSVHIVEYAICARDTKLGPEEITRDVPNVAEYLLRNLDETGIVRVGAEVKPGDVLVGKVTPKGESPMTPEEKLLSAIFGDKAYDVKDSSLYVPAAVRGTVIDVRVFSRGGVDKDESALALEKREIAKLAKDRDDEIAILERFVFSRLKKLLAQQVVATTSKFAKAGDVLNDMLLDTLSKRGYLQLVVEDPTVMAEAQLIRAHYHERKSVLDANFEDKVEKLRDGAELGRGVLSNVKVLVAYKSSLQPGDKMAGRHGNKGVVSCVLPVEDMPFLPDGTAVDIVLNPLGIPSRMNVGQVLETHLGWAGYNLGQKVQKMLRDLSHGKMLESEIRSFVSKIYKGNGSILKALEDLTEEDAVSFYHKIADGVHFSSQVFGGAKIVDVKEMLELADLDSSGQTRLLDGRTGEYFDRPVTVGYQYLMKLHHLVDDKLHARSVGPYSLVTQQPLGGKSYFGGQRFGEMEGWALQAYGASYILQEILTVKSDDVEGRQACYWSLVKCEHHARTYGVPESFKVMLREIQGLGLNMVLTN